MQYEMKNSPMQWLQTFALSQNQILVTSYDVNVLKQMLGIQWNELQIVIGIFMYKKNQKLLLQNCQMETKISLTLL